ncbi:MAG TPA: beta-ketoacyl-ACP synthase III [Phycisphaerae bacterium]|nr:beta-ketoacyl-ACP synthase III [Phycisphaerae bacterium]
MSGRLAFAIKGVGSALPGKIMTNADFEKYLDTSDEWITTRTGIKERRICQNGENTLTLALHASQKAMAHAKVSPTDIDLIVLATSTPAYPIPATACFLQHALGCRPVPAFDLAAACSGFVYAFVSAMSMMTFGQYRHALVVGAEAMSSVTDYQDRSICVILGDGAGAVVLGPATDSVSGVYDHLLAADGSGAELIYVPAGGSAEPSSTEAVLAGKHYLKMRGREVYRFAVTKMVEVIQGAVDRAGIQLKDVALIIPHQSNARIIESAMEKLSLPMDRVAMNIDRLGNTSAASIPLALDEAISNGRVRKGDWVLMAGFGGGLTWGSVLVRL